MPTEFNERDHIESVKGPSTFHDEHGLPKPEPHPSPKFDPEHPGYEVTDVNTKGVAVFIAGLVGFLIVFFGLCYVMGKAINYGLLKQDLQEASKSPYAGGSPEGVQHRGASLATNPEQEQADAARIAQSFPSPRIPVDDDDQETADMHAREDLLLEHYTYADPSEGPEGTIHIPVEQAMALVVKRGLPTAATPATSVQTKMAGDKQFKAVAPLTTGFARTGYELEQIESREQKMAVEKEAQEAKK
ncbi:hypothetical protein [Terriglobus roseus]|uniref:Uncharacterized protein n=1 Tax=Terriglobus roseus TaxID=392734 RepID=A0A1G7NA54_9BACT|nr:hypothetical protein [Terriglobus roseus]SDF70975.1 hypothetical protein SAMN05444167_3070 [Terriglobus roseus]